MTKAVKSKTYKTIRTVSIKAGVSVLSKELTAKKFIGRLKTYQSDEELKKIRRYFKTEKGEYGMAINSWELRWEPCLHWQKSLGKCQLKRLKDYWTARSMR